MRSIRFCFLDNQKMDINKNPNYHITSNGSRANARNLPTSSTVVSTNLRSQLRVIPNPYKLKAINDNPLEQQQQQQYNYLEFKNSINNRLRD